MRTKWLALVTMVGLLAAAGAARGQAVDRACGVYASQLVAVERENASRQCPVRSPQFVAPETLAPDGSVDWSKVEEYYEGACHDAHMTPSAVDFYADRHSGARRQAMAATPDCASSAPAQVEPLEPPPTPSNARVGATLAPARTEDEVVDFIAKLASLSDAELLALKQDMADHTPADADPAWAGMAQAVDYELSRRSAATRDGAQPNGTTSASSDDTRGDATPRDDAARHVNEPAATAPDEPASALPDEPAAAPPAEPAVAPARRLAATDAAAQPTSSDAAPATWSGTWATTGGVNVTLDIEGGVLAGRYASTQGYPVGTLDQCEADGRTLRGRWSNASRAPGGTSGRFQWTLAADGLGFEGFWWTDDGAERAAWSGRRP